MECGQTGTPGRATPWCCCPCSRVDDLIEIEIEISNQRHESTRSGNQQNVSELNNAKSTASETVLHFRFDDSRGLGNVLVELQCEDVVGID